MTFLRVVRGVSAVVVRGRRVGEAVLLSVGVLAVVALCGAPARGASSPATAGSLVAWGNNGSGQTDVPAGSDFTAIAAGDGHSVALRRDGSLVAWGYNVDGQTDVPAGSDFTAIAAGCCHSVALRRDGSLVAWGYNRVGQTDVPAGRDFTAVAAGLLHNVALRRNGSLIAWGENGEGQTNVPAGTDFTAVAAGYTHSVALRRDGSLVAWGFSGLLTDVPTGSDYTAITAAFYGSVALRRDGSLVAWGHPPLTDVPAGSDFTAIAAGFVHGLALRGDGSLVAWGSNSDGQTDVPTGSDFFAITAGWAHNLALKRAAPPADTTPPVIRVPATITVPATTPSGAVVRYTVTARDDVDGPVAASCAPPSGSMFPIATTTVTCTAADRAHNTASTTFEVTVKGATAQIDDAITRIQHAGLKTEITRALTRKLTHALTALTAGKPKKACRLLDVAINRLEAPSANDIPTQTASDLIADLSRIMTVIGTCRTRYHDDD